MEACTGHAEFTKASVHPILDARTLAACQQGDRDAFRCLFDTYKDRVFSISVYFLHGDITAAEDITQEVFLRIYTRIGQFREQADFTTWLYRLTANVCMDEFRRRKRAAALEAQTRQAQQTQQPQSVFQQLELSTEIQAALNDLTPSLRLTILLRYFEELSYQDIASILECSQGTVASRLNRSLKLLAHRLAHLQEK